MQNQIGIVYLIWQKGTSFYKIGMSKYDGDVVYTRQTYNPIELECIARIRTKNFKQLERDLLEKWIPYKKVREWLDIPPTKIPELLEDFRDDGGYAEYYQRERLINAFNLGVHTAISEVTEGTFSGEYYTFENLDRYIHYLSAEEIEELHTKNGILHGTFERFNRKKKLSIPSNKPCH